MVSAQIQWIAAIVAFLLFLSLIMSNQREYTAKIILNRWGKDTARIAAYWGVPYLRVLAHMAQESRGNQYWIRNDEANESYYARTFDDALAKLQEWKQRGFDINKVSCGLMQFVPAYAGKDLGIVVTPEELLREPLLNIELGVRYLKLLLTRNNGSIDIASRRYNGSLTNPKTAEYLEAVKMWEQIFEKMSQNA